MLGKEKKQTNFQLVRTVLDELDAEVQKAHGSKHIDLVNEAMDTLQGQYARLEDPKNPRIDYSTAVARLAYILKYVAAHGDYVKQVLNLLHDELGAGLSAKENLAVSCLGGGPGSELVGLLKYLLSQDECKTSHLTVHLLDVEEAWGGAWTELAQKLKSKIGLQVNTKVLDACDSATWQKNRKFLTADLFISCYFASEIYRFRDKVGLWKELTQYASKGAMFLLIDNDHSSFESYIKSEMKGWKLLAFNQIKLTPSLDEEKSDLGEYLTKYKHKPKLKADLLYALYEKP